jgi:hypothetical protein
MSPISDIFLIQNRTQPLRSEGKFFPVHAMKAYGQSKGIAPLFLGLDYRWRRVAYLISRPGRFLPPGKDRYVSNRRLVDPRADLNVLDGEKSFVRPGIRIPALQHVPWSLTRM